jgi:hypothetical protein
MFADIREKLDVKSGDPIKPEHLETSVISEAGAAQRRRCEGILPPSPATTARPMRIHVSFIDRVGITQEVLALLGARNLNLDAVEMVPPNVYIDAPTLSPAVLEELHDALFEVRGVQSVDVVDILPASAATCSSMPCWPP